VTCATCATASIAMAAVACAIFLSHFLTFVSYGG
jgi:hypothetical protein